MGNGKSLIILLQVFIKYFEIFVFDKILIKNLHHIKNKNVKYHIIRSIGHFLRFGYYLRNINIRANNNCHENLTVPTHLSMLN